MLLSDYTLQVQELVHDLAGNDYQQSELINYVNNARLRTNLDLHCVRTFFGGQTPSALTQLTQLNLVNAVEVYPFGSVSGGIAGTTLTNQGSGYVNAPTVTFPAPPPGGIRATGVAVVQSNGSINITMTNWGNGYLPFTTYPLTISSGNAAGTAVPLVNIIDIKSVTFLWPGSTNRQMLRWLPFTTFQAWCRAWVGQIGSPTAWTTHESGLFYMFPIPDQAYLIEVDAVTRPIVLVNPTDVDTSIPDPYNDCVQYYAAYLARLKLQDYDKADYWRKVYNTRVREVNATRIDARIPNIYRSSARRMLRW